MSLLSERIGRLLKRNESTDHTPSKALYDDLESAFQGVTRKASSTFSKSQLHLRGPSGSEVDPPLPSPTSILNFRATLHPPSQSTRPHRPISPLQRGSIGTKTQSRTPLQDTKFNRDAASHDNVNCRCPPMVLSSKLRVSSEENSQWQTVDTCSTRADSGQFAHDEGEKRAGNDEAASDGKAVRKSELHETRPLHCLNQFAWSPCPSEADGDDLRRAQQDQDRFVDAAYTSNVASLNAEDSSSAAESYGNTRELLQVSSSRLAGDLHVPSRSCAAPEQQSRLHNVSRVPALVSDGLATRPMSESEIKETLSDIANSIFGSFSGDGSKRNASSRGGRRMAHEAVEMALRERAGDIAADLTTSTSQITSDHTGASPQPSRDQNSHLRGKAPPLLFERQTASLCEADGSAASLPLMRKNSKLAQAAAAAGIKQVSRLGRAERDWVTETDTKTSEEPKSTLPMETATGSSLDNYSEPGGTSLFGELCPERPQNHARYNQAWSVQHSQDGSLVLSPNLICREGRLLPNSTAELPQFWNCSAARPDDYYHHPRPLPTHKHPLNTSPHVTPSRIQIQGKVVLKTSQKRMQRELSSEFAVSPNCSDGGVDADYSELRGNESKVQGMGANSVRHPSSTGMSAVSEGHSNEHGSPMRISSFAKTTFLGQRGNMTGTPDGSGAREVGSSLAGDSSPGGELSSSPKGDISDEGSPISRPSSAVKVFHRLLEHNGPTTMDRNSQASASSSFAWFGSSDSHNSPTEALARVDWSDCLPPSGPNSLQAQTQRPTDATKKLKLNGKKTTLSSQVHNQAIFEAYQKRCSRVIMLACMLLPVFGPLLGHGGLDMLIAWHSNGTITEFRQQEKTCILVYSYSLLTVGLVVLALIMILVTG